MARPIRIEFAGAAYHAMARGNERRAIFLDDQDRQRFLKTLEEMVDQFGVRLHAYCLMPNHYHLLVETPQANLSQAMGWLQVTYTVRFNRRHRRSGHLFQGRYKAQLVEADVYAQALVLYVHLNPVRPRQKTAVMAKEQGGALRVYRWSSHRVYAGLARRPKWLSADWWKYWGRGNEAHAAYRRQIAQAFGKPAVNPWEELRAGLVLGSEQLWRRAKRMLSGRSGHDEQRWQWREEWREQRERLRQRLSEESDRRVRIWARVRVGGERRVDVAREYGYRDGSGVTQLIKRLEADAVEDRALARRLENLSSVKS